MWDIAKAVIKYSSHMTIIEILLSLFLPPLGVFLAYGISTTLVINIVLTLLGWLPGVLHAFWVLAKKS